MDSRNAFVYNAPQERYSFCGVHLVIEQKRLQYNKLSQTDDFLFSSLFLKINLDIMKPNFGLSKAILIL